MFLQPGPDKTVLFYCSPNGLGLGDIERWTCFQRNMGISVLGQFLKKRIKLFPARGVGRAGSSTLAHREGQQSSGEVELELVGQTKV